MREPAFERAFRAWCGEAGAAWETFRYPRPEAGGETQAHRLRPPGEPVGRILVVHGAGNDAFFSLTGLFAELLAARFELFTFDVDGHGRHSTTRLSHESARTVVTAALEAWGAPRDGLPLHTIGISLGGSLLLHAHPELDPRVASATLLCAPVRVELTWRTIRREIGLPMLRTVWRGRSRFGLTGLIPSFGPFRRDLYPLRLATQPPPGGFGYVQVLNSVLDSLDLTAAAAATETPVLLVYGARDLLVPPSQGRVLASRLANGELLILPNESHLSAPLAPLALARLADWLDSHQRAERHTA